MVRERDIEYSFIFHYLPRERGRLLDVGCNYSRISMILQSLGYDTHGLDVNEYFIHNPNFKMIISDIRKTPFDDEFFDVIVAVSTLEHVGVGGRYGQDEDPEGDLKAVREIRRILRRSGLALITVPFGRPGIVRPWNRIYGPAELERLIPNDFKVVIEEYYMRDKHGVWLLVEKDKAKNVKGYVKTLAGDVVGHFYALACLVLEAI